jgi:hypothetical protein
MMAPVAAISKPPIFLVVTAACKNKADSTKVNTGVLVVITQALVGEVCCTPMT